MPISRLPSSLAAALAREARKFAVADLTQSAAALSKNYRNTETNLTQRLTPETAGAYAAARLPATFAAASAAFEALKHALGQGSVTSLLDAGAGPGTATFAALAAFPALKTLTQIERDPGWSALAAQLDVAMGIAPLRKIADLTSHPATTAHDIVTACYTLNEISGASRDAAIEWLWRATKVALVIVEPGSRRGFDTILRTRSIVLAQGGHIAAPCTHHEPCPMAAGDWCHFPARLERSAVHRAAKGAELSHEDEKFSYIVVTREPPARRRAARIVHKPIRAGGHVHLDMCAADGLTRTTIGKSDKANYRAARDAEWGDPWPPYEAT